MYDPTLLEKNDCKFKVIGWGNGTTGSGGSDYPAYFHHLASHGFAVVVAHTNLTIGPNRPVLTGVEVVLAENEDASSLFYRRLDPQYGLMGKSQGAVAIGGHLVEENAVAGVLIGSGSLADAGIAKPALYATGDEDFLRGTVERSYEASSGEAIYVQATQQDGGFSDGHMDLNDREGIVALSTSFMRCHLRGDHHTCDYTTCESCQVEPWTDFRTKGAVQGGDDGGN